MKPINSNKEGCSPVSSNCVIWQGPDIECIDLCKGDSVSNVVYKLATELCDLLDRLNISAYDLTCFNLNDCKPNDFKELIQFLIDKICELENVDQSTTDNSGGCPDCEVPICEEFYYATPQGDTATSMQLKDYVLAIGNTVCSVLNQIDTINEALAGGGGSGDDQQQPDNLTIVEFQEIISDCIFPGETKTIDEIIVELEKQFCEQKTALGGTTDILTAINAVCGGLNNANKLNGTGTMSQISGWFENPLNMSQSMSNLWKTVCDMRSAVIFLQSNIDLTCNAVDVQVTATMISNTTIRLFFTGSMPNNFSDTAPGSTITLSNTGGLPQVVNNVLIKQNYLDLNQPFDISLNSGVNGTANVNVSVDLKVSDPVQGYNCNNNLTATALGTASCPTITFNVSYQEVQFSFPWTGNTTYIPVELYDATGTTLLQSTTVQTATTTQGNFTGLTHNTNYKVRVVIDGIACEFNDFTTLEYICTAPNGIVTNIIYNNITGDQDATTIAAWVAEYESYFGPITP